MSLLEDRGRRSWLRMRVASTHASSMGLDLLTTGLLAGGICLLPACGDGGDNDDTTTAVTAVLLDANNYSSTTSLAQMAAATETAPGDIQICWTDVAQDMLCHDIADPAAVIKTVSLLRFENQSEADLKLALAEGTIEGSDVNLIMQYFTSGSPGATCIQASQLDVFGNPIDIAQEYAATTAANYTYLLRVADSESLGVGTRSMMFVKPTTGSAVTTVNIGSACGILDFGATLAADAPVSVPAAGPWVLGWGDLTKNGQGGDLKPSAISSVLVGQFETMSLQEIQDDIMDLELNATHLWEFDLTQDMIRGRTADLALATERGTGTAFPGFGGAGVWLVALMCASCTSPAPVVLAVLQPTP
ncbi:MAG: hypothetical protein JW751_26880 [Polyangiaceae bacterium]|nr:hypothetical protein [Polyangiaceae bacterium]